jgi:hypothetical protein
MEHLHHDDRLMAVLVAVIIFSLGVALLLVIAQMGLSLPLPRGDIGPPDGSGSRFIDVSS